MNGVKLTDPTDIADYFKDNFASIAENRLKKLQKQKSNLLIYLDRSVFDLFYLYSTTTQETQSYFWFTN